MGDRAIKVTVAVSLIACALPALGGLIGACSQVHTGSDTTASNGDATVGAAGSGIEHYCPATKREAVACCGCPPLAESVANALANIPLNQKDQTGLKQCIDAGGDGSIIGFEVFKAKITGCLSTAETIDKSTRDELIKAFDRVSQPDNVSVSDWNSCKKDVIDGKRTPPDHCTPPPPPPSPAPVTCNENGIMIHLPEARVYQVTGHDFNNSGGFSTTLVQQSPPAQIDALPMSGSKNVTGPTDIKVCHTQRANGAGGCSWTCSGGKGKFQMSGGGALQASFEVVPL